MSSCKHNGQHEIVGHINYLDDVGRYTAELRITCMTCGSPFRFLGLPVGLNNDAGATVDISGLELRVAMHPELEDVPVFKGVKGFSVERVR